MADSSNEMADPGEATVPRKSGWRGLFGGSKPAPPTEPVDSGAEVLESGAEVGGEVVDEIAPLVDVSHESAGPGVEMPVALDAPVSLVAPPMGLVPPSGLVPSAGLVSTPDLADSAPEPVALPELVAEAAENGLESADAVPNVADTVSADTVQVTQEASVVALETDIADAAQIDDSPANDGGSVEEPVGSEESAEGIAQDEPELAQTEAFDAITDETATRQAESDMVSEGSPIEELDIFMDAPEAGSETSGDQATEPQAVDPVKLPKRLVGPLAWVALLVAVGWFAVGGVVLTLMSGLVAWIIGGVAIVAGLITAYIGLTMTAKLTQVGVKIPFRKVINWSDVVGVRVVSMVGWGSMTAPLLEVADGRAIKEVELEGLASLGQGTGAAKRAEMIAAAGQVPLDGEDDDAEPEFTPRRAM